MRNRMIATWIIPFHLVEMAAVESLVCKMQVLRNKSSDDPFGGSDQSDSSRGGFGGGVGGSFGGQNSDDPFGGGVTEADFEPLIDLIRSKGYADGTTLPFPPGTGGIVSARGIVSVRREIEDDFAQFMRIGHCSWALLIGWVSGHFCMFIASRSNGKIVTD